MPSWVELVDEVMGALYCISILLALCAGGVWLYGESCRVELHDHVAYLKAHDCADASLTLPWLSVYTLRTLGRLYPLLTQLEREHGVRIRLNEQQAYEVNCKWKL